MRPRRRPVSVILLLTVVIATALPGCGRTEAPAAASPPEMRADIDRSTPIAATQSLLTLLRENIHAVAAQDREAAAKVRDQVIWHVAARDVILKRYSRAAGALHSPTEIMVNCVESWASLLAYYVDGVDRDAARLEPGYAKGRATVRVPAQGADDTATIRVSCTRNDDGQWRVREVEFAGNDTTAASAPAEAVLTTVPSEAVERSAP